MSDETYSGPLPADGALGDAEDIPRVPPVGADEPPAFGVPPRHEWFHTPLDPDPAEVPAPEAPVVPDPYDAIPRVTGAMPATLASRWLPDRVADSTPVDATVDLPAVDLPSGSVPPVDLPVASAPIDLPPVEVPVVAPAVDVPPVAVPPAPEPPQASYVVPPLWRSGPVQPAPAFPAGTVDLTGDNAIPAELRSPAPSTYPAPEPVPGTVQVDPPVAKPVPAAVQPIETQLDDHRAARARALGEVDPGADVIAAPAPFGPPSVYKGWPSFTLFVFRLVVAAILGIRATQELINFEQTKALWETSILPNPGVVAIVQIVVEYAIAIMLLIGLASRVAGVLLMLLAIGWLVFLVWGAVNPFSSGVVGFRGEFEVLLVAAGLVFAGVGGGRAAVDGAIHRARLERKNARMA